MKVFSNTGELTDQGATPTDDLFALKVSPGKAYVRGYDIERPVTTILDIEKPRDKKEIELSSVPFKFGNKFQLNNVNGTPKLGINIDNTVSLRDQRKTTANATSGTGDRDWYLQEFMLLNSLMLHILVLLLNLIFIFMIFRHIQLWF